MQEEFEQKKFGVFLEEMMRVRGFNVEKLAQTTGVSDRFISLLLEEKFDKLPASPYLRGYILKISDAIQIDGEKTWREYFEKRSEIKKSGAKDSLPGGVIRKTTKNKIVLILFVLLIVCVIGYAIFRIQAFFGVPEFSLKDFSEEMVVKEKEYTIKGVFDPKDQLFLNGEKIFPNEKGEFDKKIELNYGFNTLKFTVKKFLGKEYEFLKQIFYEKPTSTEEYIEY